MPLGIDTMDCLMRIQIQIVWVNPADTKNRENHDFRLMKSRIILMPLNWFNEHNAMHYTKYECHFFLTDFSFWVNHFLTAWNIFSVGRIHYLNLKILRQFLHYCWFIGFKQQQQHFLDTILFRKLQWVLRMHILRYLLSFQHILKTFVRHYYNICVRNLS